MSLPKVLIHCQYVYGLGHLVRALQIAKGLTKYFDVYFLSGGESVSGIPIDSKINFVQLEAIYKKEDCDTLTSINTDLTLEECFVLRDQKICAVVNDIKPVVVITEHFPFGFLFEKEALKLISYAKGANSQVKIVSSVRDVIESASGSEGDKKTVDVLNEHYDLLLIHGDNNLISMESSFSLANEIKIEHFYTGYVVDDVLHKCDEVKKNILVSVAGGRVGRELLKAVQDAFELLKDDLPHNLIVFDGAFNASSKQSNEDQRIQLFEFNRADFLEQLSRCELTISLGGYNTTIESLFAGNKVLIYNRTFLGQNQEQDIRISTFARLGLTEVLSPQDLSKQRLVEIIKKMIAESEVTATKTKIDFDGVSRSVRKIRKLTYEEQ